GDVQRVLRGGGDARARVLGGLAVGDGELFDLLAVQLDQPRAEGLRGVLTGGLDGPVLARLEGLDLLLALDDHAQRRRLHPPGRQPGLDLAPQHRRQVEADQVVERAPRLLGVDQLAGDVARLAHRFLDRARGDLGEHHPLQLLALEQAALAQDLRDVPADRLALAVRVGRQPDALGATRGLGDRLDVLFVLVDQLVAHPEAVVRIDRAFLRHQVADVAVRGQDLEVLAEVLVDRLGLGGRFDDEKVLGHRGLGSGRGIRPRRSGFGRTRRPGGGPGVLEGTGRGRHSLYSGITGRAAMSSLAARTGAWFSRTWPGSRWRRGSPPAPGRPAPGPAPARSR